MTRLVNSAESWESIYDAFEQINFAAFDFHSVKESLVEYMKVYHKESYNDFIESSEFIAVLEIFSYVIELYAYRLDVDAHENFLSTAERKQSILRLAKFLSYNASRNLPARGLVKIQTVKTTESVTNSNGQNLANKVIRWNDANSSTWKEDFILVMDRCLKQPFGSVAPDDRIQSDDVLFELYQWENFDIANNVFKYSTSVSGESLPMEIVPVALNEFGPLESRPEIGSQFSILYGSDGLGDGSDTTGFFMFTKQGTLQKERIDFDGITPNQTYDLHASDINDSDIWVNNIDLVTEKTIDDGTAENIKSGEFQEVDLAHAQNIIFNTNLNRNKFEIETLEDDRVRVIFGDGEFANIPNGTFDIWFRTSVNKNIVIPKNAVINKSASFAYPGADGGTQTFAFSFSLINSLQNASESETLDHIKRVAPSAYYSQDRMVNGKDYNNFPLQDNSILKLRALNRTWAGDSKWMHWHEPRESYENVRLFGDDLAIYFKTSYGLTSVVNELHSNTILRNYVEPLLASSDMFFVMTNLGVDKNNIRSSFTENEVLTLLQVFDTAALNPITTVYLSFDVQSDTWAHTTTTPTGDDWQIFVRADGNFNWTIKYKKQKLISHSVEMRFWNANDGSKVESYESLLASKDKIVILSANPTAERDGILGKNRDFNVIGQELTEFPIPGTVLSDIHQLSVLPADRNADSIPDDVSLPGIVSPAFEIKRAGGIYISNKTVLETVPLYGGYVIGLPFAALYKDVIFTDVATTNAVFKYYLGDSEITNLLPGSIIDKIVLVSMDDLTSFSIKIIEYVYLKKVVIDTTTQEYSWEPVTPSAISIDLWSDGNASVISNPSWKREIGRSGLNFYWSHFIENQHLVDPSPTNIIDFFVITRGHYAEMIRYLEDKTEFRPSLPTPLQLRNDYNHLLDNKMISDTVVLTPGKIKIAFGSKSGQELRAKFKVIRNETGVLTNNQIKVKVVEVIRNFFDINRWTFGETFYYTELAAKIHYSLISDVKSVVLVPLYATHRFGELFILQAKEDEIIQPHVGVDDIEIVASYAPEIIRQIDSSL
jgi:hypothetical protein